MPISLAAVTLLLSLIPTAMVDCDQVSKIEACKSFMVSYIQFGVPFPPVIAFIIGWRVHNGNWFFEDKEDKPKGNTKGEIGLT